MLMIRDQPIQKAALIGCQVKRGLARSSFETDHLRNHQ